jgi:hypothetical protein
LPGGLASVAAAAGDAERAGTLWGALQTLEQQTEGRVAPHSRHMYEERIQACLDREADAFADSVAAGCRMTPEQALEYALAVPAGSSPST